MRKILVLIFTLTVALLFTGDVLAQEAPLRPAYGGGFEGQATQSVTPSAKIEYVLPYPGLLPDSPLYFLKMLRDRMVSFLIADPLKKAEFNLLQADKRLNAGVSLIARGKHDLAISTISKGENYFEQAVTQLRVAKEKGLHTNLLLGKMSLSLKKHREVLEAIRGKVDGEFRARVETELERVKQLQKNLDQFNE